MVGAAPSFSDVHLIRTMLMLNEGKVGRKRLVKLLGVGEGSVRTIIKRLSGAGFLESDQGGHSLSRKGVKAAQGVLSKFTRPAGFNSADVSDKRQSLVVVRHSAGRIKSCGVDERDIAVRNGAAGAVILAFQDGKIKFPSGEFNTEKFGDLMGKIGSLSLVEDDVVVISFADSQIKAEDSALAIALELSPVNLIVEVA